MKISYSDHALKRMKQRGITSLQVEYILLHPNYVKKSFDQRREAVGVITGRKIKVIYIEIEKYLKIVTIL